MTRSNTIAQLEAIHVRQRACRACPHMFGPVVHGRPVASPLYLVGQAPGTKEGPAGKPFAWTAGKTLFTWFRSALGVDEDTVRARVYFAAVARCFPGKAPKGGDRKPDADEITRCGSWMREELALLKPRLVLPVGTLAIAQVLGHTGPLVDVVGQVRRATLHGVACDVIALPHPSGLSTWHRTQPGKTLLAKALGLLSEHPATVDAFSV